MGRARTPGAAGSRGDQPQAGTRGVGHPLSSGDPDCHDGVGRAVQSRDWSKAVLVTPDSGLAFIPDLSEARHYISCTTCIRAREGLSRAGVRPFSKPAGAQDAAMAAYGSRPRSAEGEYATLGR